LDLVRRRMQTEGFVTTQVCFSFFFFPVFLSQIFPFFLLGVRFASFKKQNTGQTRGGAAGGGDRVLKYWAYIWHHFEARGRARLVQGLKP
jgi:hypothetical protein